MGCLCVPLELLPCSVVNACLHLRHLRACAFRIALCRAGITLFGILIHYASFLILDVSRGVGGIEYAEE